MGRIENKVAIITGAGSGIGRASALRFAREGATVVVADLNATTAQAVADEIKSAGGKAIALTVDVSKEDQLQDMITTTIKTFGYLDVLFNNATNTDSEMSRRDSNFFTFDSEVFHHRMQTNVLGGVFAAKFAIPHMLERREGCILFTSSSSSLRGEVAQFSYGATKAAVNWYVQSIAATFGKQGIRCNGIIPGIIRTPAMENWANVEMKKAFLDIHNSPRLGLPDDIANMALFLASCEAEYINGSLFQVDGGINCSTPMAPVVRKYLS